jgi:hypothetical protein
MKGSCYIFGLSCFTPDLIMVTRKSSQVTFHDKLVSSANARGLGALLNKASKKTKIGS